MQVTHSFDDLAAPKDRREAIREELERILKSPPFRGSRRCCRFLEYSVEHVLAGRAQGDLRERNIGVEVFHRPPDYDTADDAIVRVTANEVRKRLAQYYHDNEVKAGPVIGLPAGSYAASIRWQTPEVPRPSVPAPRRGRERWIAAGAITLICLAAVSYATLAPDGFSRVRGKDPRWSVIFHPGQKTNIVLADAARFEIQELLESDISLRDYLNPDFPSNLAAAASPELQRVIRFMGTRQTTSLGSTELASRLLEFGTKYGVKAVLRHPKNLNVREFKTDNFILLGSRLSIPWVELFEPALNFVMKIESEPRRLYLENRAPRAGEAARYERTPDKEETYADVAVLPNLDHTGTVLILNAIDMLGAEAAGEFAVNGGLPPQAREVLLRVRAIGGAGSRTEVVAIRQ